MAVKLANLVAVVTGSSRGVGRGIALELARAGADIVVNHRDSAESAGATAEEVRQLGRRCIVVQGDVSQAADVARLHDEALSEFGRVDILVNNAGISTKIPFLDYTEAEFDHVLQTNLKSVFLCSQAFAAGMVAQRQGCIINVSSINAQATSHYFAVYAASKAGIEGLTRGMAIDLGEFDVRVNAIGLGWVPVEKDAAMPEDLDLLWRRHMPLLRPGTPADPGKLCVFLASDDANWLTGAVIPLDGGMAAMGSLPSRRWEMEFQREEF